MTLKCFSGFAILMVLAPSLAFSQVYGTAGHIVTVKVQPVTVLQLNAGIVNMNITGANAVAGQDQMTVTDQTTSLLWGTNSSTKKISVSTSLASPLYTLKVLAVSPTVGTAAPQVTLSTLGADLLLNIGRSSGSCKLQYTGIALASKGAGSDSHTITFTVQTQ
ncbi:MAG TPA: hypothetical protein VI758_05070 [Bacteroidota bacterium]